MASIPTNGYAEVMAGTNNYSGSNSYDGSCPRTAIPPVIGDEDDSEDESDDDEERPLSRDELKAKTLRGLTKREGQQMSKQQKRKNRKDAKMK